MTTGGKKFFWNNNVNFFGFWCKNLQNGASAIPKNRSCGNKKMFIGYLNKKKITKSNNIIWLCMISRQLFHFITLKKNSNWNFPGKTYFMNKQKFTLCFNNWHTQKWVNFFIEFFFSYFIQIKCSCFFWI